MRLDFRKNYIIIVEFKLHLLGYDLRVKKNISISLVFIAFSHLSLLVGETVVWIERAVFVCTFWFLSSVDEFFVTEYTFMLLAVNKLFCDLYCWCHVGFLNS